MLHEALILSGKICLALLDLLLCSLPLLLELLLHHMLWRLLLLLPWRRSYGLLGDRLLDDRLLLGKLLLLLLQDYVNQTLIMPMNNDQLICKKYLDSTIWLKAELHVHATNAVNRSSHLLACSVVTRYW